MRCPQQAVGYRIVDWSDSSASFAVSCRQKVPALNFMHEAGVAQINDLQHELMVTMHDQAIANGIVERTREQAVDVLERFCSYFGYNAVITFDEKAYEPAKT